MAQVDSGELVVRTLADNGVKYLFCINGGHLFPILAHLREHEIRWSAKGVLSQIKSLPVVFGAAEVHEEARA